MGHQAVSWRCCPPAINTTALPVVMRRMPAQPRWSASRWSSHVVMTLVMIFLVVAELGRLHTADPVTLATLQQALHFLWPCVCFQTGPHAPPSARKRLNRLQVGHAATSESRNGGVCTRGREEFHLLCRRICHSRWLNTHGLQCGMAVGSR